MRDFLLIEGHIDSTCREIDSLDIIRVKAHSGESI